MGTTAKVTGDSNPEPHCLFQRGCPEKLAIPKPPNGLTFTAEDITDFLEIGG